MNITQNPFTKFNYRVLSIKPSKSNHPLTCNHKDQVIFTSRKYYFDQAYQIIKPNIILKDHYDSLSELEKRRFLDKVQKTLEVCTSLYRSKQTDLYDLGRSYNGKTLRELAIEDMRPRNIQDGYNDGQVSTYIRATGRSQQLIKNHVIEYQTREALLDDL